MSLIGSIGQLPSSFLQRLPGVDRATTDAAAPAGRIASPTGPENVFEKLIQAVDDKQAQAREVTRSVLTGDNNQLHQSVIAMQEAGVAFQLMVEVRNKLVESYQELMRMQA